MTSLFFFIAALDALGNILLSDSAIYNADEAKVSWWFKFKKKCNFNLFTSSSYLKQKALIGIARDLRGLIFAFNTKTSYMMLFEWM